MRRYGKFLNPRKDWSPFLKFLMDFRNGFNKYEKYCSKCVELPDDYVKYHISFLIQGHSLLSWAENFSASLGHKWDDYDLDNSKGWLKS